MDIFEKLKKLSEEMGNSPSSKKPEFIIAGLGNPGIKYENTRHNAGFMAIETLEKKYGFSVSMHKFKALVGNINIGGKNCLVMKPETYMNLSGEAISQAMDFYKIPIENLLVIFDDISLDVGKMRIRKKGSDGGQKGMLSIIEQLGTQDFVRIKIGVGKKPNPDYDLADWVLSTFKDDEKTLLQTAVDNAVSAVPLIIDGKIEAAMNKFN